MGRRQSGSVCRSLRSMRSMTITMIMTTIWRRQQEESGLKGKQVKLVEKRVNLIRVRGNVKMVKRAKDAEVQRKIVKEQAKRKMAMNAAKMTKDRNVKSKKGNEVKNQVRLKEVMINAKEVKNAK